MSSPFLFYFYNNRGKIRINHFVSVGFLEMKFVIRPKGGKNDEKYHLQQQKEYHVRRGKTLQPRTL